MENLQKEISYLLKKYDEALEKHAQYLGMFSVLDFDSLWTCISQMRQMIGEKCYEKISLEYTFHASYNNYHERYIIMGHITIIEHKGKGLGIETSTTNRDYISESTYEMEEYYYFATNCIESYKKFYAPCDNFKKSNE